MNLKTNKNPLFLLALFLLIVALVAAKFTHFSKSYKSKNFYSSSQVKPMEHGESKEEEKEEMTKGKNYTVELSSYGFSPKNITIKVNDSITLKNKDSKSHEIVADQPSDGSKIPYKSGVLKQGMFSVAIFTKEGTITLAPKDSPAQTLTVTIEE